MKFGARTIRRDLLLVLGLASGLTLATAFFGLTLIRGNTRLVEAVFARYLALSRCCEQVLIAQSESTGCMSRALSLNDRAAAGEVASLKRRFEDSARRSTTFINAMIWGSESEAFARAEGGALAATWQVQGGLDTPVVQTAPAPLRQLAGLADIYYAAYARRVIRVLDSCERTLTAPVPTNEELSERAQLGSLITEAYAYRRLSTEMLQEVVRSVHADLQAAAADATRAQNVAAVALVAVSLLTGAVSLGFGWIFATLNVVRPLERLRAGAAVIGAGDLAHRVGTAAPDEIGQLGRSFDSMVDNLRAVMARRDDLNCEIEQRKQAEEERGKALAELRRSNADLEQFAYAASHDLQEPLRKVIAFGSLLEREYATQLEGSGQQYVATMCKAARRMQHLISALLAYSRIATRGGEFVPVNLNGVLTEVLADLEVLLRETGGTVTATPLPQVDADPTQMRQLLQNLVANALKFHRENVPPLVRVYEEAPNAAGCPPLAPGHCRLVVQDNGIGFDQRYAERIFGVFQRLHGQHEYEGSGIGLAICRRIAERHAGTIQASSQPGAGATFRVDFPRTRTPAWNKGAP